MTRTLTWPWLIGFFALAMLCWGARPLWDPDEGRYAEAAREFLQPVPLADMTTETLPAATSAALPPGALPVPFIWRLDMGKNPDEHTTWGLTMYQMDARPQWLYPHLQGQPHLTKPPPIYWLTAVGMKLWGINAWGARFFVGLAFFAAILCVVALARTWGWNVEEARAAGLVYAAAGLPFIAGHLLTTDTLLTLWETLGILACWRAWTSTSPGWRITFWIAFGLAFLTKGPPGCLPIIAVVAFYLLRRRQWALPGRICSIVGAILGLAIALTWYLVMCIEHPHLWNFFIGHEVIDRVATTEHKRNNPFYMYIFVFIGGLMPWTGFLVPLARRAWARWKAGWRGLGDAELFALLWVTLPFLVFTVSRSRLPLYVLPLFPPFAIWLGRLWTRWCGGAPWPVFANRRRIALGVAICWGALMLAFTLYPAKLRNSRTQVLLARQLLRVDPTARYNLYTEDFANQSLSFYAQRRALWLDRKRESQIGIMQAETLAGRPSALVISERNYRAEVRRRGKFQVLAKDHDDVIIAPIE